MRIVIPTTGSRGDVQPYVALGMELQGRGHHVRLATHADFEGFVRGHGLDFFPIERDARALQGSKVGDRMLRSGGNPFAFLREFARLRQPLMRTLLSNSWEAAQDADVLCLTITELVLGLSVAEKLDLPVCLTALQPSSPSCFLPNFLFPDGPSWPLAREAYNLVSHLVVGEYFWQMQREAVNEARLDVLDLPPLPFLGPFPKFLWSSLGLYGFSPTVVPKPPDWSGNHHVTGYWFLPDGADWQPPADLADFLASGPPPVYVGFGSMHNRDAKEVTALVVRALARSGQRGLLFLGWDGLRAVEKSDRLFPVESVPHDWLFPRTAAVVHHGGAGTTAAGLRAGVPSVVVPFMSDQPFWGRRVFALGAGPEPIPRKQLTAEKLARAISAAVTDPVIRRRAANVGRLIRAEDGVARAADLIDRYLVAPRPSLRPPHRPTRSRAVAAAYRA